MGASANRVPARGMTLVCVIAATTLLLAIPTSVGAQVQVTTEHNDSLRTGQNIQETILTPANVSSSNFQKLFAQSVDGAVYAQPLYVPNVNIPGSGVHNVIYVATEHDSVYAFDADSNTGSNSAPLWQTSFINAADGITTVSDSDINCFTAVVPEVGITSTPVIDLSTNTIYVLAETKENGSFFHRLHALDITTGQEKFGGPATISGSVPGTGVGSSGGILTFDPLQHFNRPGLLLTSGGNIFLSWASNCDNPPFHGWVMSYNKSTLHQTGIWSSTPNGDGGGVWMSGAGMAAADGSVYFATGNGTFDTNGDAIDIGDSAIRMQATTSGLVVGDYFTPYNQQTLEINDRDVASGGPLLLPTQPGPHPKEMIQLGKEGSIYVIDRTAMGHYNANDNSQIVQNLTGQVGGMFGAPAYWNNNVYFGTNRHPVEVFSLTNGILSSTPTSMTPESFTFPGPTPSLSSNGTHNGIMWIVESDSQHSHNEVLRAYDAFNLATELYNSLQNSDRDNPGALAKFVLPTIANGKAYVGSATQLNVYGLTSTPQTAAPTFSPPGGAYTRGQTVAIADSTLFSTIHYTTDGTTPTTSSPVYTAPITVNSTTTVKALAVASGCLNSIVPAAIFTITTGGGGALNYSAGFTSQGLSLNGSVSLQGTRLRLTDGGMSEDSSVWYSSKVNVQNFTTDFSFQMTNAAGNGMTFTIQNAGTTALGPGGAGLGYGASSPGGPLGIPNSVAVKFDLYDSFGEGVNSTGLYTGGVSPTVPAIDMTPSGVNLHSSDVMNVHMSYDGATLRMTITDSVTNATFSTSWPIDIPGTVGATTAYVGFTGATGGATAIQDVLQWTFASPYAISYLQGFTPTGLAMNGDASITNKSIRLTDGGPSEMSSAWYSTPVNVQSFDAQFSFLPTLASGDGMTFTLQNSGLTALGPGGAGLAYGASTPGGPAGIPTSIAIKFDLYDNFGEGVNSVGLYTNGASPTVPAIDLTPSGVNLHSGDAFRVHVTYDGHTLAMRITDKVTQATFLTSWRINVPATLNSNTGYVGFTGATGGATAIQDVQTLIYTH
jgi:hypothetical protein